ncbi:MAG: hypothetical protein AB7F64_06835 [Gammaproteobacteria bacterium]
MLTVFDEVQQEEILRLYNQNHSASEQIPKVIRNYETGWPLLQISLFSPVFENETGHIRYENALGGGKCTYMPIPAYFLAIPVSKIPGELNIQFKSVYGTFEVDPKRFAGSISRAINGYTVNHHSANIEIAMMGSGYGKSLTIKIGTNECRDCNPDYMRLFDNANFYVRDPSKKFYLKTFDTTGENTIYSEQEFIRGLDPKKAIFYQGQVFLDLGGFLEDELKIPEILNHFKNLFKVDEFLKLKKSNPEFKPSDEVTLKYCV